MNISLLIDTLTRLALGSGIGLAIGMTGIGAGVLVMPSLLYVIGLSPVVAVGTGLLYSMLARIYGVYEHLKLRTVRKRTAFYITLGGIPTVLATSLLIVSLKRSMGDRLDFALKAIISVAMLFTWALMLLKFLKNRNDSADNYYVPPQHFPLQRKIHGIAAGAGVGALVGSTSVGGGILLVPILASIFQLSPNNTVGTSVLVGIVISGMGSFAYMLGNNIDISVAIIMSVGSIPGIYLGSRVAVKIPHKALSIILLAVVTLGMIIMFVKTFA